MKKLLFVLIVMLVTLPSIASAHTELTTSNPTSGQVVKEDLKEIVLTYEGKIESLSTMTLVKDGKKIPLVSVTPNDNQLIGSLSTPLENGTYSIQWSIAGEDGHPISGEIPFTVQKVVKEEPKAETKQPVTPKKEEPKKENSNQEKTKNDSVDSTSNMKNIIISVVVLILIIGVFLLFRRKR
ncbi:copper resistance protein CopC [Neobacillus sp. MER 74]|uniref:copper resistance CopC family protein n=1 Tax=unclassified Neobacillus TaxID=2675272 RepID=UPI0020421588|nr:copper resistance CopC family protein [Neobacillus sp. MER 74]MCM3117187.1 copper resistance protein CopC [Neobacillus sp. MER 74]